jgi:hypothetical protein
VSEDGFRVHCAKYGLQGVVGVHVEAAFWGSIWAMDYVYVMSEHS